jgi:hypothetical protein
VLVCVCRKRLILNPQPHYKLLSGDTAFVICGGQSHANHVLQLTPESVRECMDGTSALTHRPHSPCSMPPSISDLDSMA